MGLSNLKNFKLCHFNLLFLCINLYNLSIIIIFQTNIPNFSFLMGKNTAYLMIYMSNFFLISIPFCASGPLIPFLADDLKIQQTQYSILFTLISIGSLVASLLYKTLQSHRILPTHHKVCIICLFGMVIFSIIMLYTQTKIMQCIIFATINTFSYILMITTNICLLLAPQQEEVGQWMSFSHGVYGIGALICPILVGLFQENVFIVLIIECLALVPFFYYIQSPQNRVHQQQLQKNTQEKQYKNGSEKLAFFFSLGFFILVGIQFTIQSWVSTYAVKSNIQTKEQAVRFTSIFWTLSTIFRFVFGYMKMADSSKFSFLVMSQLLSGMISTSLILLDFPTLATYACSIFYGISCSQLFPLLLSIPSEYSLRFNGNQISNMMITTTISSGIFSTLTGVLMQWNINMFYYSVTVISIFFWINGKYILKLLDRESKGKQFNCQKDIQLLMLDK